MPDLLKRNLICICIHFFTCLTEPYEYWRFNFMEDQGQYVWWFFLLSTITHPIRPLFILAFTTIQVLGKG